MNRPGRGAGPDPRRARRGPARGRRRTTRSLRDYRTDHRPCHERWIELLVDRLVDYRALVRRTPAETWPRRSRRRCRARRAVGGRPGRAGPGLAGAAVEVERAWTTGRTDSASRRSTRSTRVVTGCAVAIAETGTLVLDGSPDQGRRAITLVPDHHVASWRPTGSSATCPRRSRRLDPTRPLTLISGPCATSDIELNASRASTARAPSK